MTKSILKKTFAVKEEDNETELGPESDLDESYSSGEDGGLESYDESVDSDIGDLVNEIQEKKDGNEADTSDLEDHLESKKVKGPARENPNLLDGQNNQQYNFASVMGNLLHNADSEPKLLSQASKDNNIKKNLTKDKKRKIDVLEVIGSDGIVEKIVSTTISSKKEKKLQDYGKSDQPESSYPGKLHFPVSKSGDPFCKNPSTETDVVKEKKLRVRATQGVMNLFNELEKYRTGIDHTATVSKTVKPYGKKMEISAIATGKNGLIDFLTHKRMPADRSIFGAEKK